MKKLLIILFTLIAYSGFSQVVVDSTGGLKTLGNYPLTTVQYVKGANQTVPTKAAMFVIPVAFRQLGMLVYVINIDSIFQLKGDVNGDDWQPLHTGGNFTGVSNAKTILDTVQTSGNSLVIAAYSNGGRVIAVTTLGENGSGFLPTFATALDSTYIFYPSGPTGQIVYKLSVVDASDTVRGSGVELNGNGSTSGTRIDTLVIFRNDTLSLSYDTTIYLTNGRDTTIYIDSSTTIINADTVIHEDVSKVSVINALGFEPAASPYGYDSLTNKPALKTVAITGSYPDLINKPALKTVATSGQYADLLGRPTFAAVATSGQYADLFGRPIIPAQLNLAGNTGSLIVGVYPNLTSKMDTTYLNGYLSTHNYSTGGGSGNSASADCYHINTHYGLISAPYTGETLQQYQLTQRTADSLGLQVIRQGLLSTSVSNYNAVRNLLNSNRQVAINIRNTAEDGSRNFTSNAERAAYVNYLDTLFRNTLAPTGGDTLIIAANEEANAGYHILDTSTNLANQSAYRYYNNEVKIIDSIAKKYGTHFQTTNGGATGPVQWWFVWRNMMDSGRTADADLIARQVFAPGTNLTNFPANASYALPIKFTRQLLPYILISKINFWNVHVNFPTNGTDTAHINHSLMSLCVEAWQNLTGKNVITTELAANSINPNIIAEAVTDATKAGMQWILMYDGVSQTTNPSFAGADVSFRNTNNSINAVGTNMRNTVNALRAAPVTPDIITSTIIIHTGGSGGSGGDTSACGGLNNILPVTQGDAPTITSINSTTNTPTIIVRGTNASMELIITVASSHTASGDVCIITYNDTWPAVPKPVFSPVDEDSTPNPSGGNYGIAVKATSNKTLLITTRGLPAGTYTYNIHTFL